MRELNPIGKNRDWRRVGRWSAPAAPLLTTIAIGLTLIAIGLTFLGRPSAPMLIIADDAGRLGIVETDWFKTLLDEPLPEYVVWFEPDKPKTISQRLRGVLGADNHDHSLPSRGGLNWFAKRPAITGNSGAADLRDASSAREKSIWSRRTRDNLVPLLPPFSPSLAGPSAPSPVDSSDASRAERRGPRVHIGRIPPRKPKAKGVGHVKPDSDREAVWLTFIDLPQPSLNAKTQSGAAKTTKPSRARELKPGKYSVGWLFVIAQCDAEGGCKLNQRNEADCLKPETLTDHVLGMTHLVIPRSYLYPSKGISGDGQANEGVADLLKGGGLALLAGADYDYVSLRVSLHPSEGLQPTGAAEKAAPQKTEPADINEQEKEQEKEEETSSAGEPSPTKAYSIAMLDERLHEILAMINRTDDLNDGDLVLILPSALDFDLGAGDYLIVGFDEIPPPLRSHYRGLPASSEPKAPKTAPGPKNQNHWLAGPMDQSRSPAARISAAVEE